MLFLTRFSICPRALLLGRRALRLLEPVTRAVTCPQETWRAGSTLVGFRWDE